MCEQEQCAQPLPAVPLPTNKQGVVDLRKLNTEQLRRIKPSDNIINPFANMTIQDSSFLDDIDDRSACVKCSKSRKYFCYTCYVPLPSIADRIPSLQVGDAMFLIILMPCLFPEFSNYIFSIGLGCTFRYS